MSDDAEDTLIRQRRVLETSEDEKMENQDDCESESESEKEKEIGIVNNNSNEQTEKDSNVDKDQSEKEPVKDNGNGCISPKGTQKTPESSPILTPRVFRGIQPRPPPSFISRQVTNAKNFLIELFEFIMLL